MMMKGKGDKLDEHLDLKVPFKMHSFKYPYKTLVLDGSKENVEYPHIFTEYLEPK